MLYFCSLLCTHDRKVKLVSICVFYVQLAICIDKKHQLSEDFEDFQDSISAPIEVLIILLCYVFPEHIGL